MLSTSQVDEIQERLAEGQSLRRIQRETGHGRPVIRRIQAGTYGRTKADADGAGPQLVRPYKCACGLVVNLTPCVVCAARRRLDGHGSNRPDGERDLPKDVPTLRPPHQASLDAIRKCRDASARCVALCRCLSQALEVPMARIRQLVALVALLGQYLPLAQLLQIVKSALPLPTTPDQVGPWLDRMGIGEPLKSLLAPILIKLLTSQTLAASGDPKRELEDALDWAIESGMCGETERHMLSAVCGVFVEASPE